MLAFGYTRWRVEKNSDIYLIGVKARPSRLGETQRERCCEYRIIGDQRGRRYRNTALIVGRGRDVHEQPERE
ncbi:MAG: hypothetical protein CL912_33005 [Deltaproteobacteria bacterium]|nr:hypothetical protein [Deltaproteobacteria bacterium]